MIATDDSTISTTQLTQEDRSYIAKLHCDYLRARGNISAQQQIMEEFFIFYNSLAESLLDEALKVFV